MQTAENYIKKYKQVIEQVDLIKVNGRVSDVIGLIIVSIGPNVSYGEICKIVDREGTEICYSEVVGFKNGKVLSIALGEVTNISPSCQIIATGKSLTINVGNELLGRVLDGLGNPIDDKGPILTSETATIYSEPPNPLTHREREFL